MDRLDLIDLCSLDIDDFSSLLDILNDIAFDFDEQITKNEEGQIIEKLLNKFYVILKALKYICKNLDKNVDLLFKEIVKGKNDI